MRVVSVMSVMGVKIVVEISSFRVELWVLRMRLVRAMSVMSVQSFVDVVEVMDANGVVSVMSVVSFVDVVGIMDVIGVRSVISDMRVMRVTGVAILSRSILNVTNVKHYCYHLLRLLRVL